MKQKFLPFFWDYQITDTQLRDILNNKEGETQKIWALSRILESAPYEEVWKYTSLNELKKIFPKLKLKKPIQKAWQRALRVWEK